jgi:hypothetical protein
MTGDGGYQMCRSDAERNLVKELKLVKGKGVKPLKVEVAAASH